MTNFSSLLQANHSVVEQLVKTVYANSETVQDDNGHSHLLFISYYRGRKVYFNEHGMVLLYRSAIAFFLGINKQNINRSINALEEGGFFDQNSGNSINLVTVVHGQSSKRPVAFYDEYVISLVASKLTKPTQEARDFLRYRHEMLQRYQEVLMQAMAAAYRKGFTDGQHSQAPTALLLPPSSSPAPIITADLPENASDFAQQWHQLTQQVELLTERMAELMERMEAAEKNHRVLAGKHEELDRTYFRDMPRRLSRR